MTDISLQTLCVCVRYNFPFLSFAKIVYLIVWCLSFQMKDEGTLPRYRLTDRLRTLRNFRPRPEEGKEMKDERGLDNVAFPEGSWE